MHGLTLRALQCFFTETYGFQTWVEICQLAQTESSSFEAMLIYDTEVLERILKAAARRVETPEDEILEDVGLFLITHPSMQAVRRLLRFGGDSLVEFLFSLEDLKDRVAVAMPDLDLPKVELHAHCSLAFSILLRHPYPGFGSVLVGALRALSDDYGTLAFIQHGGSADGFETVFAELLEIDFATGRDFSLVAA